MARFTKLEFIFPPRISRYVNVRGKVGSIKRSLTQSIHFLLVSQNQIFQYPLLISTPTLGLGLPGYLIRAAVSDPRSSMRANKYENAHTETLTPSIKLINKVKLFNLNSF